MNGWIPVFRYRGELAAKQCPQCGFLIAAKLPDEAWNDLWSGALLCCVRCNTVFREGLEWLT